MTPRTSKKFKFFLGLPTIQINLWFETILMCLACEIKYYSSRGDFLRSNADFSLFVCYVLNETSGSSCLR